MDSDSLTTTRLFLGADGCGAPVSQPRRRVVLLIYHADGVAFVPLVPEQPVIVGRAHPSDVVIPDRGLSRRHARFTQVAADVVTVEDLGSTNGTLIAGERLERATLKPGDQVMLGTIAATVHAVSGDDAPPLGLEGHDSFLAALGAEIARARFFGRPLAVLVVHAMERERGVLPRWCPRVRQLLRPVDRIGFYGAGVVEILLPEATLEDAHALGRAIVERHEGEGEPPLACGVAVFPGTGSSAEILVSAAREAAHGARPQSPLRDAESGALRTVVAGARPPALSDLSDDGARPTASGDDGALILRNPAMRALADTAARVARSAIPVLVRGETGSGKEVLARLIHDSGPRAGKPLVCVNCGAIPVQLVESTLFGHERGAFTGALQQQKGVFEAADGGTVLLDEIGELPAPAQAALLRVLEAKRVTRVGSVREIEVDVRVIAATHRDLEGMCESGGFRLDLYHRLNTLELSIPPLRARREDIPPLAARFLAQAAEAEGRGPMTFEPEALKLLERYSWPGNVRELRNVVERAVVIAEGASVTTDALPERLRARAGGASAEAPKGAAPAYAGTLKERMESFERDTLVAALREADGNQTAAARLLDLPLRTLQHKIKSYGLKKQYQADEG